MTAKPKSKADIWMPFYVGDYLADTMHLSAAEHGGYLMLMLHYWKSGPIPDDDARLAIISRLGDAWSNASSTIRAFFKQRDGMLVHDRIEKEKTEACSNNDKNQARAKAAADKRWGKNAPSTASSIPQAVLNECPSPSPSPSSIEDKNISAAAPETAVERRAGNLEAIEAELDKHVPKFDGKACLLAEGVDQQLVADFLQLRKTKKAPVSQSALDGIKREAAKAGMTMAAALAMCCERGWQGFNAEWVVGTRRPGAPEKPSAFHGIAGADHTSSIAAMEASRKRMGVPDYDPNDNLDFDRN